MSISMAMCLVFVGVPSDAGNSLAGACALQA
jgi:hypothetical protein